MSDVHMANILGVTATRNGLTDVQKTVIFPILLWHYAEAVGSTLHHGDCVGGDADLCAIAREIGYTLHCHPPDKDRLRAFVVSEFVDDPLPYLDRNKVIVNRVQLLLAAPGEEEEVLHSGTWSTIRYALKMGRPVILVLPSGRIKKLNMVEINPRE